MRKNPLESSGVRILNIELYIVAMVIVIATMACVVSQIRLILRCPAKVTSAMVVVLEAELGIYFIASKYSKYYLQKPLVGSIALL